MLTSSIMSPQSSMVELVKVVLSLASRSSKLPISAVNGESSGSTPLLNVSVSLLNVKSYKYYIVVLFVVRLESS